MFNVIFIIQDLYQHSEISGFVSSSISLEKPLLVFHFYRVLTMISFAQSEAKTSWFPFKEIKLDELIFNMSSENSAVHRQI